jgi:hypothetical protein
MNLCRLMTAVSSVYPQNKGEESLDYAYRRLLIAAAAVHAMKLFAKRGKRHTSGSDPKVADVLNKYYQLTKLCRTKEEGT